MIVALLYLLSFVVILYHNYCAMRDVVQRPAIARSLLFFLFYLGFAYGVIGGVWYEYG